MSTVTADALAGFSPHARRWFEGALGEPTPAQRDGWPPIAARRARAAVRADRLGQDAGGVPVVPRPAHDRAADEGLRPCSTSRR